MARLAAGVGASLALAVFVPAPFARSRPATPALPAAQVRSSGQTPRPKPVPPAARVQSTLSLVPIWTTTLPAPPSASPAFDDGQAYVPLRNGRVVAVSLSDGAIRWSVDRLVTIAPAAGEDMAVVASEGTIVGLAAKTGAAAWHLSLDGARPAQLLQDAGWLIAGTEKGEVVALRAQDGARLWQHDSGAPLVQLPAIAGDRVFLSLKDGRVVALELRTGRPVWARTLGGPPARILPLEDRLFVGCEDKYFYCLDATNGKIKWRWRTGGQIAGVPAVDEKHVYFISLDNQLRALNRGGGSQAWRTSLPVRALAGPLQMGDLLLVSGISADIRAYRPMDGAAAGEVTAAGELVAPPHVVAAGGAIGARLVVLTGTGHLQLFAPPAPKIPEWFPLVWWN
jgi:outer membrane protein assembly factor BamB